MAEVVDRSRRGTASEDGEILKMVTEKRYGFLVKTIAAAADLTRKPPVVGSAGEQHGANGTESAGDQ